MGDFIPMDEVISILGDLKNTITSNLSDTRLSKFYTDQVDGFIRFCRNEENRAIVGEDYVSRYYEAVTGATSYKHPGSLYLRKKARAILLIRDSLARTHIRRQYRYNSLDIPEMFKGDIAGFSKWMLERGNSPETIKTRIGRVKMFLLELEKDGCLSMGRLTISWFMDYVSGLFFHLNQFLMNLAILRSVLREQFRVENDIPCVFFPENNSFPSCKSLQRAQIGR